MGWWNDPDRRIWLGHLLNHFAPPPPAICRQMKVVEVPDQESARAEFELVKVGTATTPAEYDLMFYLHPGEVIR